MLITATGATGFLGRSHVGELDAHGHALGCWRRPLSALTGFEDVTASLEWGAGELGDDSAAEALVQGCDAAVHSALYPSGGFGGAEEYVVEFVEKNVLGTLKLIEAARKAGVGRFVFISTDAVLEKILDDQALDEAHPLPLWATPYYGAHKAAIEKFIHNYGLGDSYPICALRPTGIDGIAHPIQHSKWFDLVRTVVRGGTVTCQRGRKEVHAADMAKAVSLLFIAPARTIAAKPSTAATAKSPTGVSHAYRGS